MKRMRRLRGLPFMVRFSSQQTFHALLRHRRSARGQLWVLWLGVASRKQCHLSIWGKPPLR